MPASKPTKKLPLERRRTTDVCGEKLDTLSGQVEHMIKALWQGNGQEAVVPRLVRIETTLKEAARLSTDTAKNVADGFENIDKRIEDRFDQIDEKLESLTDSVKEHHRSLHLNKIVESPTFWVIALVVFIVFHGIATYVDFHFGGWLNFVELLALKWMGVAAP